MVFETETPKKQRSICPFAEKVVPLRPYRVRRGPRSRVAPCVSCRFERKGAGGRSEARPPEKTVLSKSITHLMYAIVEINGHQFKVEQGRKLFVDRVRNAESGQTVEFDKVLLIDADGAVKVGAPTVEGAKVVAEVTTPLVKGDKVLVFHKKRRKGHRKLNGYRHQFTEVTIKEVIA